MICNSRQVQTIFISKLKLKIGESCYFCIFIKSAYLLGYARVFSKLFNPTFPLASSAFFIYLCQDIYPLQWQMGISNSKDSREASKPQNIMLSTIFS
ncbi:unnamed protein product [Moneuplotes crassus]|uniref:Uncharacterized protein n=1 Tax=Euplotes crassus TaxID=5936 RepID=A0AAD1XVA8_EUPCR|nr:unnamed protein product [Moneuplotes crassus]